MNVLFSSTGRRVGLMSCFREALDALGLEGRILAADAAPHAPAAHLADAFHLVPRCTTAGFLDEMLEICRRERVRVLIPTIDTELPLYAANQARFAEAGVHVACSGPEAAAIAADKRLTHGWFVRNGFLAVRQGGLEDDWTLPVIVKPASGSASAGLRRVDSRAELLALRSAEGDLVVEEIAPGVEYTVHVYVDGAGRCLCAVPCRRLEVRAGEVSKGCTAKRRPLMELARDIAQALPGARGPLNIQIFENEDGAMRVIEINARFGGGYPLAHRAGARFAHWILEEALGRAPEPAFDQWQDDLAMLRFDEAVYLPGAAIREGTCRPQSRRMPPDIRVPSHGRKPNKR